MPKLFRRFHILTKIVNLLCGLGLEIHIHLSSILPLNFWHIIFSSTYLSTFGFEFLPHTRRFTQKRCHCCEQGTFDWRASSYLDIIQNCAINGILAVKLSCNEEIVWTFYTERWNSLRRIFNELFLGEMLFGQKYDNPRVWIGLHSCKEMDICCISVTAICFFILVIPHFLSDLLVFWWEFPARGELTPNVLIAWILLSASPRQRQRTQKTEACSV